MKPPKLTTDSAHTAEWWQRDGILYFLSAGTPALAIKIGMASVRSGTSVAAAIGDRLRKIQTSNHELIQVIGLVIFTGCHYPTREAEALERELHIRFREHRRFTEHTVGAEWFNASPEILTYVDAYSQKPEALGISRYAGHRVT